MFLNLIFYINMHPIVEEYFINSLAQILKMILILDISIQNHRFIFGSNNDYFSSGTYISVSTIKQIIFYFSVRTLPCIR